MMKPIEYAAFQPMSLDAQQKMLAERLRARRHLVILDNLESITGSHLAIKNILPEEEREALRGFLRDLADGRTIALLGSRGGEQWLSRETFEENVYDVPGLDAEAASAMAEKILERFDVKAYRKEADFEKLLKLLDGYPLAMEVVFANLKRQKPDEVLAALQAGDVALDRGDTEKKTESILRCIDYSHSNLSPEAQGLLTCLAPFSLVFNTQWIKQYTEQLRQQPALAHLPFDRWGEVLQEAANWGLVNSDPEIPGYLRLQPIFPYFLRAQLNAPEQKEIRQAVETAFRQHYDEVGKAIAPLFESKEAKEKQIGFVLASLEYENLATALDLALEAQVSIVDLYQPLFSYAKAAKDHRRGLEMGEAVFARLESYPVDKLSGQLGAEFVTILDRIALLQFYLNQDSQAEASYQKALSTLLGNQSYDANQIRKMSAPIYYQLGLVAQKQRQWQQAESYYQQALQIFIEINDHYSQASTYHSLGMIAQEQRHWQQAESYYQQALQIEIDFNHRLLQANTYDQLGILAQEQQHLQQAEDYYQQALQIYVEFNDRYEQAGTYHNLGLVAQEQRQWQQAERYYQQALQIKIEFNNRHYQASTYHQLGLVAQKQRHWQQAESYYQQALQIKIEFNDRYEQASTYHQLGIVAQEQRQWQHTRDYFLKSLAIVVEFNDEYRIAFVLKQLARLWQESGDASLPAAVAGVLNISPEKAEELMRGVLNQADESSEEETDSE